jgi:hypothetical protein
MSYTSKGRGQYACFVTLPVIQATQNAFVQDWIHLERFCCL